MALSEEVMSDLKLKLKGKNLMKFQGDEEVGEHKMAQENYKKDVEKEKKIKKKTSKETS